MYDYMFRYILLGNNHVGKTSFTNKLITNRYSNYYEPTIGVDYATKSVLLNNKNCLITGAGGSIGSELSKQICEFKHTSIRCLKI